MLKIPTHEETEARSTDTTSLEEYKRRNIQDLNELEQLQQRIADLQVIIDKRTQLIQILEEYGRTYE